MYIFLILIIFLVVMLFFWKRKKLKIIPFKSEWREILENKVAYYHKLTPEEKIRFENEILYFFKNYRITGVDLILSDEDRLLVASSGVIPIFGFKEWQYFNLNEVLLYPNSFNKDYETMGNDRNIGGMVGSGAMNGTMILSRKSLYEGFEHENKKGNVGIHEFVHLIDEMDGAADGLPQIIMKRQYTIPWLKMMHEEIKTIKYGKSDINPYGASSDIEFLAVSSEYFFTQPELLKQKHPQLFDLLATSFNQKKS